MNKNIFKLKYKGIAIVISIVLIGSSLSILVIDGVIRQSNKMFKFEGDKLVQSTLSYPTSFVEVKRKDAKASTRKDYVSYIEGDVYNKNQILKVYSPKEDKDIAAIKIESNRNLFVLSWSDEDRYIALAEKNMQIPETTIRFYEFNKKDLSFVTELNTYNTKSGWINSKFIFFTLERRCVDGICHIQDYVVNVFDLRTKEITVVGSLEEGIISGESIYPQTGTARITVNNNEFQIEYDMEKSDKIYETKTKSYKI